MKTGKTFHLQDIINLEYLFQLDKESSPVDLHKRDRQFAASLPPEKTGSPGAIRSWLSFRLNQEFAGADQRSPGAIFADFLRIITVIITFAGLLSGGLAGLAFFSYSGTTPVNVFQFLLLFIAPQLFFIVLLLFSLLVTRLLPAITIPTFYTLLFERSRRLLAARLRRHWQGSVSAAQNNAAAHALAIIKTHSSRYGSLFYWPFFTLIQGFGLAFNLALLGVSLLKIATSDLAFGWQSTIQLSNATIHQLVTTLALPWSWFAGGERLLPTITEIAGSRIILKDGIYHLTTADLTSWWPFLIVCLLVYGVLTRLLFLLFGWIMGRRAKGAISLDTPQCKTLLQRMTTPLVTTQATEAEAPSLQAGLDSPVSCTLQPGKNGITEPPAITFIAIDIYEQLTEPEKELAAGLAGCGLQPQKIAPFLADYGEDQQLLLQLTQIKRQESILLLLEGWMVPLVSLLSYIKEIRQRIPANATITIALVGQPAETVFTPVDKKDFIIWQQKIETLADPYIHLIPVTGINP